MINYAYREYVSEYASALAVVRACKLCKFYLSRRLGTGGGRGNGFREGNRQRGAIIQHLKTAHAAEYAAANAKT